MLLLRDKLHERYLKIGNSGAHSFNVVPDIKHNTCEEIKKYRKTNGKKRRVNKKQPDFGDRNMQTFAQISTNAKRISFKKS